MNTFNLKIIASDKVFYTGKCGIIVVPALDGELAVMSHHENMVIASTNTQYELWANIDNRVILKTNALRLMLQSIIPANLVIRMLQEMIGDGNIYVGGMVSMVNKINIVSEAI